MIMFSCTGPCPVWIFWPVNDLGSSEREPVLRGCGLQSHRTECELVLRRGCFASIFKTIFATFKTQAKNDHNGGWSTGYSGIGLLLAEDVAMLLQAQCTALWQASPESRNARSWTWRRSKMECFTDNGFVSMWTGYFLLRRCKQFIIFYFCPFSKIREI